MPDYSHLKRIPGEERWVDFDEHTNCYGVFGVESGFCYSTWATEEDAEKHLND